MNLIIIYIIITFSTAAHSASQIHKSSKVPAAQVHSIDILNSPEQGTSFQINTGVDGTLKVDFPFMEQHTKVNSIIEELQRIKVDVNSSVLLQALIENKKVQFDLTPLMPINSLHYNINESQKKELVQKVIQLKGLLQKDSHMKSIVALCHLTEQGKLVTENVCGKELVNYYSKGTFLEEYLYKNGFNTINRSNLSQSNLNNLMNLSLSEYKNGFTEEIDPNSTLKENQVYNYIYQDNLKNNTLPVQNDCNNIRNQCRKRKVKEDKFNELVDHILFEQREKDRKKLQAWKDDLIKLFPNLLNTEKVSRLAYLIFENNPHLENRNYASEIFSSLNALFLVQQKKTHESISTYVSYLKQLKGTDIAKICQNNTENQLVHESRENLDEESTGTNLQRAPAIQSVEQN